MWVKILLYWRFKLCSTLGTGTSVWFITWFILWSEISYMWRGWHWTYCLTYNICTIFGSNIWPRHHSRMCFKPLGIYTMSFQSFVTLCDLLQCFYSIFNLCSLISDLSLHWWTILWNLSLITLDTWPSIYICLDSYKLYHLFSYSSSRYLCVLTIVYLFNMFPTFSGLFNLLLFLLFSQSHPFGLLVISNPSNTILTSLRSFYIYYLAVQFPTENTCDYHKKLTTTTSKIRFFRRTSWSKNSQKIHT